MVITFNISFWWEADFLIHYVYYMYMKEQIPGHFNVFRSNMSQQHHYNPQNGCMPKIIKPGMEKGTNKTY